MDENRSIISFHFWNRNIPQYAGTCTANLVLFGLEITELQMGIKSYFVLRVVRAHLVFLGHTTHYHVS